MNFAKATGLSYEAEAVRQAINSGQYDFYFCFDFILINAIVCIG
jgi:hypothetical protein